MRYRYEGELRQCAERFIESLAQVGIEGTIMADSLREYSVKVAISRGERSFGPAIIYYSPKKGNFTMRTHELKDASIASELEACWNRPSAPGPTDSADGLTQTGYQIYVDGSCLDENVGYGLVVLKDGQIIDELYGPVEDEAVQGMRQVAGELRAVQEAIAWCREHSVAEVSLFYDYEGIEKWATGEWRANRPATRAYARAAGKWSVVVHWHKVESHIGNRWNDYADQLAKRGATQHQQATREKQDPLSEARSKASQFAEFLVQRGIAASFQGLVNDQFARVVIGSKQGYLDVYSTRRRPVSDPYLHGFRDLSLKDRVESLWQEFLLGSREGKPPREDSLRKASYYYEILRPYRDCEFDFIDLARALSSACEQMERPSIDVEATRYDFEALESLYSELKRDAE